MQEGSITRYAESNQTWHLTIPDGHPKHAVLFFQMERLWQRSEYHFRDNINSGKYV